MNLHPEIFRARPKPVRSDWTDLVLAWPGLDQEFRASPSLPFMIASPVLTTIQVINGADKWNYAGSLGLTPHWESGLLELGGQ